MAKTRQASRPTLTDDLVQRLGSSDTDPKEMKALKALSKEMIKVFRDERRLSHVREAAALAPFTAASNYQELSRAFNNAIIGGTADSNILEPQLLKGFTFVLRCAEGTKRDEVELGSVAGSLQVRLNSAVEQAEPKSQYQLICALSSVLDAMIDLKTAGLSREKLHEPLLKQLATLSKDQELRLAQAAGYAYQALLGIPNDEGPYRALWRHTSAVVEGTTNVTGAVSTMDPAKLFEGLAKLQDLPRLISSIVDVVRALSGLANSLGDTADGVRFLQNQKSWYVALRFTDMLIQAKAFKSLEDFLPKVPCSKEREFLCGIFAQLEQAWETGDPSVKGQIVDFLERVLIPAGSESPHPRVFKWVKLVANTLGRSDWMDAVQPARRSWHRRLWKQTKYASTFPCLKMPDEALPADLLKQAWLSCIEVQVFYADVKIREYYLQDERRLKVERLSGKPLSMDQCYVNLAIVEHSSHLKQSDTKHQSSPFSLLARLKVETPHQDSQVSLASLFSPRKRRDGTTAPPERIFIRGQAGVGKTTLCKKIVYDNLYDSTWASSFGRLLWVPLRTLKGKSSAEYNLKDWLRAEYFRTGDGDILAEAVRQAVDDPEKCGKTLFILDGLDEVSRELDSETSGLLQDLLNQPHVIITSRPGMSMARINRIDLELETVGFYPEQVQAYIKKAAPDQVREIQSFLQDRSLLQGLVRIPIQLEALCYSWDAGTSNSGGASTTMTTLYQAIERKLWKKDAVRLGKPHGGIPLSVDIAKSTLDSEIASWVMPEVNLLRCLAFTGLYSNVIELDKKCQEQVWTHWNDISEHLKPRGTPPSSLDLATVSFLRSSDTSSDEMDRGYHFLHLTFQEYFAAQYFVEHWKSNNQIPCLALSSGKIDPVSAEDFLLKEKYNARYDIFWRFVAGLLQPHGDGEQLCRFFETIEKEPRDLLGPTHQRLVMHCLSELMSPKGMPTFTPLRTKLEDQMSQWLLFECNFRITSQLADEMEFPEQVLNNVLQRASKNTAINVLRSLGRRPKIPLSIIGLATDRLEGDASRPLSVAALHMLHGQHERLPDRTLKAVLSRFEDQDDYVRRAAVRALGSQSTLPENILKAVAARFEDQDIDVRQAAAKVLKGQPALPEVILKAMAARLAAPIEVQYGDVKQAAAEVLKGQSALYKEFLKATAAQLKHQDRDIRQAAVQALRGQSALPEEILEAVAACLKDQNRDVRWEAVQALEGQSALPEEILKAVAARLEDQDRDVRWAVVDALGGQSALPEEILKAVAARLEDQDRDVRQAVVDAFGGQSALPKEVLGQFAESLYPIWLEISFEEHSSCYVADGIAYIDMPVGLREVRLEGQQDRFRDAIREARRNLGIPLPDASGMECWIK
ncbi:armadillo-type protein [Ilyonectria destructans]|nr:armadillo-type protein [Ilyonectria destructans]